MPLSLLLSSITDRTQKKTQTLSVLEEEFGKRQVPQREMMVSAPSGLMAWTLLPVPFRVRKRQDQVTLQELGTVALAVCLKRRLGPAPSSELLGDGVQNWEAPSRNLSGPSAFQEGLSWPHCNLQPELGPAACVRCSFLSDIPLHTRPPCLVSTRVSFPDVSVGTGCLAPHFPFQFRQGVFCGGPGML